MTITLLRLTFGQARTARPWDHEILKYASQMAPSGFSEDLSLQLLLKRLHKNRGMDFSLYKKGTLERRVLSRLRATSCLNYIDYITYLNKNPDEYDRLLDALTINVTEFLRDPEAFERIKFQVIPLIVKNKQTLGQNTIRVWSAGTSKGEEAYSLAITFLEVLGAKQTAFDIKIYGTDIDLACLENANRGLYGPDSLKNINRACLAKYFLPREKNFAVNEALKSLVKFKRHDLASEEPLPYMDLILCRNTVIYFTRELQERVFANFKRVLVKGGFLVLGRVETLSPNVNKDFETWDINERIYRKK